MRKQKKETVQKGYFAVLITTLLLAAMEMTGLPAALLPLANFGDITPTYLILLLNFMLGGLVYVFLKWLFFPEWSLGLNRKGLGRGLWEYGLVGTVAAGVGFVAFAVGLRSVFDVAPSFGRFLVEGVFYCIGVSLFEEVYLRGLLQNLIEKVIGPRKNAALWAVLITSALFGLGHIAGVLSGGVWVATAKALWTFGLGIYFGAVYKKAANLWVAVVLHILVNISGILFCFTTTTAFPAIGIWVNMVAFLLLGAYGFWLLKKPEKTDEKENTKHVIQ